MRVLLLGGLLGDGAGAVSSAPRGSIASSKSEPPNLCLARDLQGMAERIHSCVKGDSM